MRGSPGRIRRKARLTSANLFAIIISNSAESVEMQERIFLVNASRMLRREKIMVPAREVRRRPRGLGRVRTQ